MRGPQMGELDSFLPVLQTLGGKPAAPQGDSLYSQDEVKKLREQAAARKQARQTAQGAGGQVVTL